MSRVTGWELGAEWPSSLASNDNLLLTRRRAKEAEKAVRDVELASRRKKQQVTLSFNIDED